MDVFCQGVYLKISMLKSFNPLVYVRRKGSNKVKKYKRTGHCPDLTRIKNMKIFGKIVMACVITIALGRVAPLHAQPLPGRLYPYVKSSTIIVHRDEYGGMGTSLLFSTRVASKNKVVDINSVENKKLPAQFEVKIETKSSGYSEAEVASCPSGWRMPTYNEMLLIAVLHKLDKFYDGAELTVMTATTTSDFPHLNPCRYFVQWARYCPISSWVGKVTNQHKPSHRVCIRDIDTKHLNVGLTDL